jgi:hypothetical protein
MDTISGKVLEVAHDYEGIYHVTIEANIANTVALIRFDLPNSEAQPEKWTELLRRLCVPCKEHGIYPVPSDRFLALATDRVLGIGNLRVHCPNDQCRYFAEGYDPGQWNALMKQGS